MTDITMRLNCYVNVALVCGFNDTHHAFTAPSYRDEVKVPWERTSGREKQRLSRFPSLRRKNHYANWELQYTTKVIGAGNETRTRDFHLGKVVLYQLSYSRFVVALCSALATRPSILAHGDDVSIALGHCRSIVGNVAVASPLLSKLLIGKFFLQSLAIANSWDIIKVPKQFIRR